MRTFVKELINLVPELYTFRSGRGFSPFMFHWFLLFVFLGCVMLVLLREQIDQPCFFFFPS